MSVFRLDCVFYHVTDLDRAIRFYTEVMEFELLSRDVVARFQVDGLPFELVPTVDPAALSGRGNARLTLAVEDIEAASRHFRARGVRVSPARDVANGRLATIEDPDGNEIVLWQGSPEPRP